MIIAGPSRDIEILRARITASFASQGLMSTLKAELAHVSAGAVEIVLKPGGHVSQQHGFVHAGAISAIADTAAGYAALSLMPEGKGVLTTEFKINLLAPAVGDLVRAKGRVIKAGRTLTLAQTDVFAEVGGQQKLVAFLTATLMTMDGREGIKD
ncbi:MAG: PaaI family thioesterase [Burkholderiales bacterium]|nr:MAG: PaaI family thioesterase [Burkholderiales bacterium]